MLNTVHVCPTSTTATGFLDGTSLIIYNMTSNMHTSNELGYLIQVR